MRVAFLVAAALHLACASCGDSSTAAGGRGGGGAGGGGQPANGGAPPDGGAAPGVPVPSEEEIEATLAIAETVCAREQECHSPVELEAAAESFDECAPLLAIAFASAFFGPDSGATLESARQCGQELELPGCLELVLFTSQWGYGPEACQPTGERPNGAQCGYDSQCESGACLPPAPGDACGLCVPMRDLGQSCDLAVCDEGVCAGVAGCVSVSELGGDCDETSGPACFDSNCSGGVCVALLDEGAPCGPATLACGSGLTCNPFTSLCSPLSLSELGESCGQLANGDTALCRAPSVCALIGPNDAQCVDPLPLGAPCTHHYLFGSGCEKPASCIQGVCQYGGARACPEY